MTSQQYESYLPNYVDNKISALVGGAPESLNTIAKIAQSLGNNTNLNTNIQQQLTAKQDVITDNSLSISKIAGLTSELNNKYNKSDVDSLLLQKQSVLTDNSITMNKVIGLQTELDKKASLISPVFLGTPIAPTAGISNNSTQIATTEFVNDKMDELINDVIEDLIADIDTRATTTQMTTALSTKYDKAEVNTLLSTKQDIINDNSLPIAKIVNLQNQLDAKATLASPSFIGVPTAPTPSVSTNNTQIATTAYVKDVVSQIIDGSPAALDTLKEISSALNDDKNFFVTINNSLATKAPLNNATFNGTTTFTGPLNIPINGINIANIQGLQTEINDLKTNTSLINNLADGSIPVAKVSGLAASLDTKLTASSNVDAGKIVNWANVMNNAIDINKINQLQSQLDAKTANTDPIMLSRVTGLESSLNSKANTADVYTKTQSDTSLGLKANAAAVFFKDSK
jgi:hypothetical protein